MIAVVVDEEERFRLGSIEVPGWPFAVSVVLVAVAVVNLEVEVGVVVRGSGTCLSTTWIESTTVSQPKRPRRSCPSFERRRGYQLIVSSIPISTSI